MRLKSRLVSFFLTLALISGSLPYEFFHLLDEEHDLHQCDFETCVRELEHQCLLDSQVLVKKLALEPSADRVLFLHAERVSQKTEGSELSSSINYLRGRSPPFLV